MSSSVAIRLSSGTIKGVQPDGPPLAAGALGVNAFRYMREMTILSGGSAQLVRWVWIRIFRWLPPLLVRVTYRLSDVELHMEQQWVLDEGTSQFPAPPSDQIQVYVGNLGMSWVERSASFVGGQTTTRSALLNGRVSVRYPPIASAQMSGKFVGSMTPAFFGSHAPFEMRFSSVAPAHPGVTEAIYPITDPVLRCVY